jgi:predicted nucleic acid-binding protein
LETPKIYVDSNVFLNVWFEEMQKLTPAFYYSRKILDAVLECRFQLVISDLTVKELSRKTGLSKEIIVKEYMKPYEMLSKLTIVKTSMDMIREANTISREYRLHAADALHVLVAKNEKCSLVTRDKELTRTAKRIDVRVALPEELI